MIEAGVLALYGPDSGMEPGERAVSANLSGDVCSETEFSRLLKSANSTKKFR